MTVAKRAAERQRDGHRWCSFALRVREHIVLCPRLAAGRATPGSALRPRIVCSSLEVTGLQCGIIHQSFEVSERRVLTATRKTGC